MQRTARNSLGVAFALSILLHLALLPIVRAPAEPQPDETTIPIAFESARPTPTPQPTPRPTPTPTPTPRPTLPPRHLTHVQPRRRSVNVAHQSARPHESVPQRPSQDTANTNLTAPGTRDGVPNAPALPAASPAPQTSSEPSPAPTRPPACAQPNVAAVTIDPVVPETPQLAQQQGIMGDVTVLVSLDEESHITGAHIVKSPSVLLDDSALRAARASTFRTEVRDCRPIAADYAFIVEFTGQ